MTADLASTRSCEVDRSEAADQAGSERMDLHPFRIDIPALQVADLERRLTSARLPTVLDDFNGEDGTSLSLVSELVKFWVEQFDWRSREVRLNSLPHYSARIGEQQLHFLHKRGEGPAPLPIVLTHGWPGSFIEFEHLLPLLTEPSAHGADPEDAFHVVVPSLPGYAFSPPPTRAGTSSRTIAGLWHELMTGLGYERFVAHGGDIGAGVSLWLGREHPNSLLGVHLNYVSASVQPWRGDGAAPITPEEQAYLDNAAAFAAEEGAYAALQATKPQTLAFALTDSPIGLAAWMAEKFQAWTDNNGDLTNAVSLETIVTDIALYWFSGSIGAALRLYKENRREPIAFAEGERIGVPVGVAHFPRELPMPPRSWVERFAAVTRWSEMPSGGHFAALEKPQALAEEIRAFCRPFRTA